MQPLTTEKTKENAMTKWSRAEFAFPSCKSGKVTADITGGNITSLGGLILLSSLAYIRFEHILCIRSGKPSLPVFLRALCVSARNIPSLMQLPD